MFSVLFANFFEKNVDKLRFVCYYNMRVTGCETEYMLV